MLKFGVFFWHILDDADWGILGPSDAANKGNLSAEHPKKEEQHQQRDNTSNRTPTRPGASSPERILGGFGSHFGRENGANMRSKIDQKIDGFVDRSWKGS